MQINIPTGHERGINPHQIVEEHSCNNNDPQNPQQILDFINGLQAGCTLRIVVYGINNLSIIRALNAARNRGVILDITTDRTQWNEVLNLNRNFRVYVCGKTIEPGGNRPNRYIHSKFAVAQCPHPQQVDQHVYHVLLGSCNWTDGSIYSNFEYCVNVNNLPSQANNQPNQAVLALLRQFRIIRRYKRVGDPHNHSVPSPPGAENSFCTVYEPPQHGVEHRNPPSPPRPSDSPSKRKKVGFPQRNLGPEFGREAALA